MNASKVVLGVLAGVALGAVAGILLAPDKGAATRKNIADKSTDYAKKLHKSFKSFIDELTEKFVTMTDEAEAVAQDGANKLAKGVDQLSKTKGI
jgi:gas vesicle protein